MKVRLAYFKNTGKFYATGECDIDRELMSDIFCTVAELHRIGELPGLVRGARYITLVEAPGHPDNHPALIGLSTPEREGETHPTLPKGSFDFNVEPIEPEKTFDLAHELEIRRLDQRTLGAWLYEAIYLAVTGSSNVHTPFSPSGLYLRSVEQLQENDMISEAMVGPMMTERTLLGTLKRMNMMLTALHITGHIEPIGRVGKEGKWRLTTHGVQSLFALTTQEARLAFALELRREYDRRHQYT